MTPEQGRPIEDQSHAGAELASNLARLARDRSDIASPTPPEPAAESAQRIDQARQNLAEIAKPAPMSLAELSAAAQETNALVLYHGGLPESTTLDDIDLSRPGSQQNRRGRSYGGFYLSDETSRQWATDYAAQRNGNLHGFLVDAEARVLEVTDRDIDRLSQPERERYAADYDLVKGKDLLGRAQYVLLNKGVVNGLGLDHVKR